MDGALMRRFASLAVHAHIAAEVMIERQVKISNDPVDDVPDGHPEVVRFMGAPLAWDDGVLGMVAVANTTSYVVKSGDGALDKQLVGAAMGSGGGPGHLMQGRLAHPPEEAFAALERALQ